MQSSRRSHPVVATSVLLVACPLLSAVTLAGIAVALAAAFGAQHLLVIGGVIAAAVFVMNAGALCMAVTRGEDDARVLAFEANEPVEAAVAAPAHARAS